MWSVEGESLPSCRAAVFIPFQLWVQHSSAPPTWILTQSMMAQPAPRSWTCTQQSAEHCEEKGPMLVKIPQRHPEKSACPPFSPGSKRERSERALKESRCWDWVHFSPVWSPISTPTIAFGDCCVSSGWEALQPIHSAQNYLWAPSQQDAIS